jgi:non-specific serine/threonine protein kinase
VTVAAGQVVSHYRLVEKIGEGGMGVVWRARDESLDREVAVKFLPEQFAGDPDRRTRFEREAKAVAALNHPNIVTIHSVEEADGLHFFTMELAEGRPLSKLIPEDGLALARFLEVALPLSDAIASAHERGIIHRDLKPGNIMLADDGTVKILDFGLAKFREDRGTQEDVTATTVSGGFGISGTVNYMSPEQARGESLDHRSDLFSLGIILYEMATGRRPFEGRSPAEAFASILKDTPTPINEVKPELPRALGSILRRCLEKDLKGRMQSALDLRNELEGLGRGESSNREEFGPSVAVLPFADMSPEKDQDYFCEGMAEEIINALSGIQGLRVAPRTSSFQFRDTLTGVSEIGRRLRVATLLEGSVRKSGGRLRITVQLIDVDEGYHLWSERYDREMTDIFAIQDEIAAQVVAAFESELGPAALRAIPQAPTRDVQAYDYYLRGRKFYFQYGRREIEFALQLFSRAIELDPAYALAHAGLSDCWSYIYLYAERSDLNRGQADAASRRAVELAPDSAQAQASRGVALSLGGRDREAREAFETAIRLDPGLFEAHYFYARHCFAAGDAEQAVRLYERAGRARPEDYQSPLLMAQIYDDLGRAGDAEETRRRGIRLAEEHVKLNPQDARAIYLAANGMVALGERERGLKWVERARRLDPDEPMLLYNVGCIYSLAGRPDQAIESLERAFANGLTQREWFEKDSNLDPLRDDKRFVRLMERVALASP